MVDKETIAVNAENAEAAEIAAETANAETAEAAAENANVEEQSAVENAASENEAQNAENGKKKRELPKGLKKISDYLNAHEDIRQMVFFLLFSVICGASQLIVTYALSAGLKLAPALSGKFEWFVFKYDTSAEFIGFLVGSIVGQVLTFILNRKKTFNTTDYVALRAVMYAIMAVAIIVMQTYLGGVVTSACYKAKPEAEGFLALVFNLTGQAVAGVAAVIINFLGNKFLVMRDWGKKKRLAEEAAKKAAEENANADENSVAENAENANENAVNAEAEDGEQETVKAASGEESTEADSIAASDKLE